MKKQIPIADSELPIMKSLWEKGEVTSPEIFADMKGNKSTLKTLLQRLVAKGVVKVTEINSRNNKYLAVVSQDDYIKQARTNFIQKAFDGSAQNMLLNFVKEEKITREDLQKLINMVEE